MTRDSVRREAERIVHQVLDAVRPDCFVERAWTAISSAIDGSGQAPVDLIAFGKASIGMVDAVVLRLDGRLRHGIVLAPAGSDLALQEARSGASAASWKRLAVRIVDHPTPTARNVSAATEVESLVREGARDSHRTLLVLISGGGSAHLALPTEGLTLESIAELSTRLMRAGATIGELNTVRKHLERLKGGRLARLAAGGSDRGGYSRVVSLVVSDVIGDDLSVIASGPLTADATTYTDALDVLRTRGVRRELAPEAWQHLERGMRGVVDETPKPGQRVFDRVEQHVIGSNLDAIEAARLAIESSGVRVVDVRGGITGEASARATEMVGRLLTADGFGRSKAVVWGGETTVTVGKGRGVGGRNQEFALAAARALRGSSERTARMALSFGTDGVDGPTAAAGGFATGETWDRVAASGVDPERSLREHDSHLALAAADSQIRTGPTGTNVNDVMVAVDWGSDGRKGGER